jgi:hypothetical protein
MKLNLKKVRFNQLVVLLIAIVVALYLIRPLVKPEGYEGEVGPSPGPSEVKAVAKEKELSQAELDAVLKFIA